MQSYPYLTGPDQALNRRLIKKTKAGWTPIIVPDQYLDVRITNLPAPYYGVDEETTRDRQRRV
jgi:hypothetical protein